MKKLFIFTTILTIYLISISFAMASGEKTVLRLKPYNSGATLYGYGGDTKSAASSGTSWFSVVSGTMQNPLTDGNGKTVDKRTINLHDYRAEYISIQFESIGIKDQTFPTASSGITLWAKLSNKNTDEAWTLAKAITIQQVVDMEVYTGNTNYVYYPYESSSGLSEMQKSKYMRIYGESGASDITPVILMCITSK